MTARSRCGRTQSIGKECRSMSFHEKRTVLPRLFLDLPIESRFRQEFWWKWAEDGRVTVRRLSGAPVRRSKLIETRCVVCFVVCARHRHLNLSNFCQTVWMQRCVTEMRSVRWMPGSTFNLECIEHIKTRAEQENSHVRFYQLHTLEGSFAYSE